MFIIDLTYCKPLEEVDLLLESHTLFLKKYYASGNFLLSGRKNPRTGGVILANAANLEEIQQILTEDPFNRNGVARYAITEILPTMAAEGLEMWK